jgi:hypothetical protein
VKYNTFVTFYAWLPFLFLSFPSLPFPIIFLLTSTGQTGKPISMVDSSSDASPTKEVPFSGLIEKIHFKMAAAAMLNTKTVITRSIFF